MRATRERTVPCGLRPGRDVGSVRWRYSGCTLAYTYGMPFLEIVQTSAQFAAAADEELIVLGSQATRGGGHGGPPLRRGLISG